MGTQGTERRQKKKNTNKTNKKPPKTQRRIEKTKKMSNADPHQEMLVNISTIERTHLGQLFYKSVVHVDEYFVKTTLTLGIRH